VSVILLQYCRSQPFPSKFGLATWQPREREAYREMGEQLAHEGYVRDRFKEANKTAQA